MGKMALFSDKTKNSGKYKPKKLKTLNLFKTKQNLVCDRKTFMGNRNNSRKIIRVLQILCYFMCDKFSERKARKKIALFHCWVKSIFAENLGCGGWSKTQH